MATFVWLVFLGGAAGALSTLAGVGGGMLLVVVLSATRGPKEALAVTSPALLFSNIHRAWIFRKDIDRRIAKAFGLGAFPGAIVGGFFVPALPPRVLSALLVGSTVLVLLRARGILKVSPHRRAITPLGLSIGALTATSGGAGMLVGPLYLSLGLTGAAYAGTVAVAGVSMHLGRLVGYGVGGMLDKALLPDASSLLAGLVIGNVLARRVRARLSHKTEVRIEIVSLSLATALAVLGLAR
jgi:uncharacterized protein